MRSLIRTTHEFVDDITFGKDSKRRKQLDSSQNVSVQRNY
jgi:hypothetical protein